MGGYITMIKKLVILLWLFSNGLVSYAQPGNRGYISGAPSHGGTEVQPRFPG